MPAARVLLIKGRAGLGNRVMSALTGILYARLAGRRVVVDWRDPTYSDGRVNAFPHYFTCPLALPVEELPRTDSVAPSIWRGHLDETAWNMSQRFAQPGAKASWREFSIELERLDYEEEVAVLWTFTEQIRDLEPYFTGAWAHLGEMTKAEILRMLLQQEMGVQPAIRKRVEHFAREHLDRPSVGVHVRYSDHRVRLGRIFTALDHLLARSPELRVFLSTDSVEVLRVFERRIPGTVSTPHWYPPPGQRLHDNSTCPDPLEAGAQALIDVCLLARCSHLVVDTSSSFARMALLMSDLPAERVVDVHPDGARAKTPRWIRRPLWLFLRLTGVFTWAPRILGARLRDRDEA